MSEGSYAEMTSLQKAQQALEWLKVAGGYKLQHFDTILEGIVAKKFTWDELGVSPSMLRAMFLDSFSTLSELKSFDETAQAARLSAFHELYDEACVLYRAHSFMVPIRVAAE